MSGLADELRRLILSEGPIPVERYMALCLGHPKYGYYMTRDPLGATGDFTTSPEISQMFGELIGLWAAQCWLDMGSPSRVRLLECGPGRGTLMADALRAARTVPGFRDALHVDLVETSPVLKAAQVSALAGCGVPTSWHASLHTIPADRPVIVIGNEFLDALPIRRYVRQHGRWHEQMVGLAEDRFVLGLSAEPETALDRQAPEGALLEIAVAAIGFVQQAAGLLRATGGVALFIDYGHAKSSFGDTLQAIRRHAYVDPLATPGDADLTAHVDFEAVGKAALAAGLCVFGPMEQGPFLKTLGLEARADQLIRNAKMPGQQDLVRAAEHRLAEATRTGMGALFKVIAFAPPGQPVPPAFDVPPGSR